MVSLFAARPLAGQAGAAGRSQRRARLGAGAPEPLGDPRERVARGTNNFLLDGVDNNDLYINRLVVSPPLDSVREFRLHELGNAGRNSISGPCFASIAVAVKRSFRLSEKATMDFRAEAFNFGNRVQFSSLPSRSRWWAGL